MAFYTIYKDANGIVKDAPNGTYMANGDIYIDLNAGMEGEGFVLNTFAHELTHHIRDWSPTKFKALADFLVKEYGKAGQSVDELVHARIAKSDLDYDAAFEEVVADSMEKMFTDGNIMDKLAKLKAQDKGLLQRIKNFIDKWLSKIKEFYSAEGQYVTREGELAHQLEKFEQLQQLFAEALMDAGENYQMAEKNPSNEAPEGIDSTQDTRMFSERRTFKNGQNARGEFIADVLIDLADINSKWWTGVYNHAILGMSKTDDTEFRQFYQEIHKRTQDMEEYGKTNQATIEDSFIVQDGKGKEYIYQVSLDGYLHGVVLAKTNKAKYVAALRRATKGGQKYGQSASNIKRRTRNARSNMGRAGSSNGGNNRSNGNLGSSGLGSGTPKGNNQGNNNRGASSNQGVQNQPKLKKSDRIYMDAIKRGDMETAQRMVDEAAKAAGYSRLFYHGAKKGGGFTEFRDWSYFTESRKYAERYAERGNDGSLYKTYVKLDKPFDTRDPADRRLFAQMRSEYGLGEIQDSGLPDWTDGYDISDFIDENDLDYDGIILDEGGDLVNGKPVSRGLSYVVRKSAQIKSADPVTYDDNGNVIPLSERFNQENKDIRYSYRGKNVDGIEVYETSQSIMNLSWKDRKAKYLDVMRNVYRGRTARFERNGHVYYARFDQSSIRKHVYGDNRSSADGVKALIKAGADGDIFDIVERSRYTGSEKNKKNHTKADYFDYFVKTVQIDGKVFDLVADVEKNYGVNGGYVYTLALVDNKTQKASPALGTPNNGPVKSAGNASGNNVTQPTPKVNNNSSPHSDRTGESISNRSLLANAFESMAQNDIERQKIAEYKAKIETKEAEERKLRDLKEQIKEMSFAKGPRDTAKLRSLRDEAIKTANRLSIYDGQLLRLEASKPLQNVLLREKKKAYDRAKAEGKKAIQEYKSEAEKKQKEIISRYQESRTKAVEGRNKTAIERTLKRMSSLSMVIPLAFSLAF